MRMIRRRRPHLERGVEDGDVGDAVHVADGPVARGDLDQANNAEEGGGVGDADAIHGDAAVGVEWRRRARPRARGR